MIKAHPGNRPPILAGNWVGVETDHCSPRDGSQLMRLRKPAGRYTLVPSTVNDSCDTSNVPQEDSLGTELSDKRPV